MREPKLRWGLVFINAWGESVPWITCTARGRTKAINKLFRILDRRPGVLVLMDLHPEAFNVERVA
jgi:hypothetical protein